MSHSHLSTLHSYIHIVHRFHNMSLPAFNSSTNFQPRSSIFADYYSTPSPAMVLMSETDHFGKVLNGPHSHFDPQHAQAMLQNMQNQVHVLFHAHFSDLTRWMMVLSSSSKFRSSKQKTLHYLHPRTAMSKLVISCMHTFSSQT